MKTIRDTVARKGAWLTTMALVAAMYLGDAAFAQATPKPPERMTYQGFLTGADGTALGNSAPKAYDVLFRIYDAEQGGNLLWGEQQTVTVDKGYFSVLLGEGAAVTGVPNAGIVFSSLFTGATASDRFVGVTVKGIGSGGTDVDILPRVRFLSSPYAYLAASAVKLVQTTGADLLTSSGNTVTVSGSLVANGLTAGILTAITNVSTPVLTAGTVTVTNALSVGSITTSGSALNLPSINASGQISGASLNITNGANVGWLIAGGNPIARSGSEINASMRIITGTYFVDGGGNVSEPHDQPAHSCQRIAVGRYRITLTKPFSGAPNPVVIVNGIGANPLLLVASNTNAPSGATTLDFSRSVSQIGYDAFDVHTIQFRNTSGGMGAFKENLDSPFHFIVIGAD